MTHDSEEGWYIELEAFAEMHGESVADYDAWIIEYHAGKTPEEAFFDEWPEHKPS